jgi:hypothetical protein
MALSNPELDRDVVNGIRELRRFKVKSGSTARDKALHRFLGDQMKLFFWTNSYVIEDYEPHLGMFDAIGMAHGESLICGLHHDETWLFLKPEKSSWES